MISFRNLKSPTLGAIAALPLLYANSWSTHAQSLSDQWFVGVGGAASWLEPDPETPGINTSDSNGVGGTVFIGRDLDARSSLQLQFIALGEADLNNGDTVNYNSADASVVYRFFDTRDRQLTPRVFGASIYGRFALGYLDRSTDTELERDSDVFFGVGAGIETYLTNNIAVRGEGFFHDVDAVSTSLSAVFRFGGSRRSVAPIPINGEGPSTSTFPTSPGSPRSPSITARPATTPAASIEVTPTVPVPSTPRATSANGDSDFDGVPDSDDLCPASTRNYPVRADGCALLNGVLSGVKFGQGSPDLAPGSDEQLDFLVNLLTTRYPFVRIELHSHTDNEGDVRSQAILTRGRLRTVGTYLVDRGVSANRIVLRSFGGSRPLFDNATAEGRANNNRIEILERPQ